MSQTKTEGMSAPTKDTTNRLVSTSHCLPLDLGDNALMDEQAQLLEPVLATPNCALKVS